MIQLTVLDRKIETPGMVAAALIQQYADRFSDNPHYLFEKIDRVVNLSNDRALLCWFNLDDTGKELFAEHLRMKYSTLESLCENIKILHNGGDLN